VARLPGAWLRALVAGTVLFAPLVLAGWLLTGRPGLTPVGWVCVAGSSAMPPNSSGTPRYRMPISSAFSRMCGISRCAGSACHSRQRSAAIHGMTTSST